MANIEGPWCGGFVRDATTTRLCGILDGLANQRESPVSSSSSTPTLGEIRTSLCPHPHNPNATIDPFTLIMMPPDGSRVHGRYLPIWLGVYFSSHVSAMMREAYSESCRVYVSANGLPQWEAPLSRVVDDVYDETKGKVSSYVIEVRMWS